MDPAVKFARRILAGLQSTHTHARRRIFRAFKGGLNRDIKPLPHYTRLLSRNRCTVMIARKKKKEKKKILYPAKGRNKLHKVKCQPRFLARTYLARKRVTTRNERNLAALIRRERPLITGDPVVCQEKRDENHSKRSRGEKTSKIRTTSSERTRLHGGWTERNGGLKSAGSYRIHSDGDNGGYWIAVTRFTPATVVELETTSSGNRRRRLVESRLNEKKVASTPVHNSSSEIYIYRGFHK